MKPHSGFRSVEKSHKLSAAARKAMPRREFALPGGGKTGRFPISDPLHARLAISGATRSERAGNITPAQEEQIKAKARAKLKA